MRNRSYRITLLVISSFIVSCSSDDDLNYQNDFQNSKNAWSNFKVSANDSYTYVVSGSSVFTAYSWETAMTVSNGIIVRRDFKYIGSTEHIPEDQLQWSENQNELNNNESSPAADALTLDEVYNKAESQWLIKRKHTTTYFESNTNGLLSTCGYVEKGCMDDCLWEFESKVLRSYKRQEL